jgi:Guanylate-binding protein, N-terminal domain
MSQITPSRNAGLTPQNRAVHLVHRDARGQWECSPDGLATLAAAEGPVAVLCVAGQVRQGKSTLLNLLLRRLQDEGSLSKPVSQGGLLNLIPRQGATVTGGTMFEVSANQMSCTQGLWLWAEPIRLEDEIGGTLSLVRPCPCKCQHTASGSLCSYLACCCLLQ